MQANALTSSVNPLLAAQRHQLLAARRLPPAAAPSLASLGAAPTIAAPATSGEAPAPLSGAPVPVQAGGTFHMRDLLQLLSRLGRPASGPGQEPASGPADRGAGHVGGLSMLQKLIAAWGRTDSEFDLDRDGTVGMSDLLMLLREGEPGGAAAGVDPLTDDQARSPLQQLLDDWGRDNSRWDLDGSGTVGIQDLLALLKQMRDAAEAGTAAPAPRDAPSVESVDGRTPLERLQADWGKADSPYDLDRDGTVGMGDLLAMLRGMREAARQPLSAGEAPQGGPLAAAPRALRGRAAAAHLAAALLPQLAHGTSPGSLFSALG